MKTIKTLQDGTIARVGMIVIQYRKPTRITALHSPNYQSDITTDYSYGTGYKKGWTIDPKHIFRKATAEERKQYWANKQL